MKKVTSSVKRRLNKFISNLENEQKKTENAKSFEKLYFFRSFINPGWEQKKRVFLGILRCNGRAAGAADCDLCHIVLRGQADQIVDVKFLFSSVLAHITSLCRPEPKSNGWPPASNFSRVFSELKLCYQRFPVPPPRSHGSQYRAIGRERARHGRLVEDKATE